MPNIRRSKHVHLIAYAAPVTRSMLDFSSLAFYSFPALPSDYTLPSWLPVEVGILAGRLYMEYDDALHMTNYLTQSIMDPVDSWTTWGGKKDKKRKKGAVRSFCPNPASFLLEWLPLRRTAQDVLHTPAAYVCQGRPLRPDHAFFSQSSRYLQPGGEGVVDDDTGPGDVKGDDDDVKIKEEKVVSET